MTWSYSSVNSFATCPHMFKLTYIDSVNRKNNFFSEYGLFSHKILENYFKDKLDIMPAMRTILAYFFIYSLFNKIQMYAERQGYSHKNSPLMMCIGFIVSSLLSSLPDPYWLISVFNFVFLIPAFQALNYAKLNSQGLYTVQMKKFSLPQKFLVAFGIVFWLLILHNHNKIVLLHI